MQCVFPIGPVAQPVVGEMEMHSVVYLATLQTPLATFFPSKKRPKPSFWDSPVQPRERKVLLSQRAHTPLSRSLCVCSVQRAHTSSLFLSLCVCSARGREEQRFNSVKHRYYVASLILHASIAEITAQCCLYLMCLWFHQTTVRLSGFFLCRLTSWKGELVM